MAIRNEEWSRTELDEALQILDSVVYSADEQSGAIGFYEDDSFIEKL